MQPSFSQESHHKRNFRDRVFALSLDRTAVSARHPVPARPRT